MAMQMQKSGGGAMRRKFPPSYPICQGCHKYIEPSQKCLKIEYGSLGFTAHPHAIITKSEGIDWFHVECDKAFREVLK